MKELDILLEQFVAAHEQALAAGQWLEFEALLALEDDLLWDCVRQPEKPEFSDFRALIGAIHQINHERA